jgi:LysM repeat protein
LKENGLKKNSIIIIPSQEAIAEKVEKVEKTVKAAKPEKSIQKPRKHVVKWYETLEDVAQKYGVTVEAIIDLNNIQDPSAATRMKILIPNSDTAEAEKDKVTESKPSKDSTVVIESVTDTLTPASTDTLTVKDTVIVKEPKTSVNFALLLPMAATGTTSKLNYMDFYTGVLFALYNSSNAGIETDIKVFDTANDAVPDSTFFDGCDFVIGPVYNKEFKNIMSHVPAELSVISPLDHRTTALTDEYPNMIQAPTNRIYQYRDLVKWLASEVQPTDTVLYISETNARDTVAIREMKETLESSGLRYNEFSYTILQGRSISSALLSRMTKTGNNRIIIESESEAWVNDLVRNLTILSEKAKITLYSPSKIRSFESIDAENLYTNSLHVCLSYNIDYERPEVKNFLLKYRAIFHTEPTLFAFQGYDIATYFINLVNQYGYDWREKLEETPMRGLQATFDFHKKANNSAVNEGVRRIEYLPDGAVVDSELNVQ